MHVLIYTTQSCQIWSHEVTYNSVQMSVKHSKTGPLESQAHKKPFGGRAPSRPAEERFPVV